MRISLAGPVLTAAAGLVLSGCQLTEANNKSTGADGPITVTSTNDDCEVSADSTKTGTLSFSVKNEGDKVTEFYLYGEDGLRIVGEVENIGPGLSRDLVVRAAPGKYVTACKPGMTGKGIRSDFAVTGSAKDLGTIRGVSQGAIDQATTQYAAYVKDQSQTLVEETKKFVDAIKSGDDDTARALYPLARVHWERIETVAESFGDLDPQMDAREADLEPGQKWTGWHRLEKDLWPPKSGYQALSDAEVTRLADLLMKHTTTLDKRVQKLDYTVDQISNGSKGLLDEVATGKVTGEEEAWSHTDLYDFQANVDGARVAYEGVKPLLEVKDAQLSQTIGTRFDALQKLLDQYRKGKEGFVNYETVGKAERKQLSDAVNALSEPLSKMTGALTL